jgi:hypothetical protein
MPQKLLDLVNQFSKGSSIQINTKISSVLNTNIELYETGAKKIIPFIISTNNKYLGINLTTEVKYLYSENHETFKEIEKNKPIDGKVSCVHKYPYYHQMQFLSKYQ